MAWYKHSNSFAHRSDDVTAGFDSDYARTSRPFVAYRYVGSCRSKVEHLATPKRGLRRFYTIEAAMKAADKSWPEKCAAVPNTFPGALAG